MEIREVTAVVGYGIMLNREECQYLLAIHGGISGEILRGMVTRDEFEDAYKFNDAFYKKLASILSRKGGE